MNDRCATCGMRTGGPAVYHPFLYCELYGLGHRDPGAYLAGYGFTRAPASLREVEARMAEGHRIARSSGVTP